MMTGPITILTQLIIHLLLGVYTASQDVSIYSGIHLIRILIALVMIRGRPAFLNRCRSSACYELEYKVRMGGRKEDWVVHVNIYMHL